MPFPEIRRSAAVVRTALVALAVTAAAFAQPAFAWSARAHQMVGDIATQFLTPAASAAVTDLLRDDLDADGKPSGRKTLGAVASWPDELRNVDKEVGAYHFVDIPLCGEKDPTKYCKDGKCGPVWFKKQIAILKDRSQPARARNEALKWIVHLAGDLHQPLHTSDDDDRGGNDVAITFLGQRTDPPVPGRTAYPYNLHTAWDRLIPYRMFDQVGGYEAFLANRPNETTRRDWEVGDMDAWSQESYVLAHDFIYPALPIAWSCDNKIGKQVVAIDAAYDRNAAVIVAEQIRKGGVRLAKVLNETLSGDAAKSP
jgi:S1/P1 Nuclease